jgi:hypothetical protein
VDEGISESTDLQGAHRLLVKYYEHGEA